MSRTQWRVCITLESSTRERIEAMAQAERRSVGNYISVLLEKDARERETA